MAWLAVTLAGLVVGATMATAHALAGASGVVPFSGWMFATWLAALTAVNGLFLVMIRRQWDRLNAWQQAASMLWSAVGLWYWTAAPLFYVLTIVLDERQLAWAALAFLWEVPVIGGGLFLTAALALLRPVTAYLERHQITGRPEALYRWTLLSPVALSGMVLAFATVGYVVGSVQLGMFADLAVVEQVKGVLNGLVISAFLAVLVYFVFDVWLGQARARLRHDFPAAVFPTRRLVRRVVGVTTLALSGGAGLLGITLFSLLQRLLGGTGIDTTGILMSRPEALGRFGVATILVVGLTASVMMFIMHMLTYALRALARSVTRTEDSMEVELLHTADEFESLSRAFAMTIAALAQERDRLQESRLRSEAVFQSLGEGVVVTNREGVVQRTNRRAAQLLGWKMNDMLGRSWLDVVKPSDEEGKALPLERTPLYVALQTGKHVHERSLLYQRFDESRLPVSVTAAAVLLRGQVVGAVLVFRDITEERAIDRAKTEFVSLASHQLRTPLTAINWYIEMLLQQGHGGQTLSESQRRDLSRVAIRSRRMIEVVNDLLNVSRLETGRLAIHPQPTDLPALIRGVLEELHPMARQFACDVIFHKAEELPHNVLIDRSLLRQVLNNILTNAIKYSKRGQGSRIWVQLERDDQGGYVMSVQDEGVGIPAAVQPRVFEKFIRADNVMKMETEGSGLGLYVVKMIMEACGGEVWFESVEGKGATFYVRIPPEGMQERSGGVGLAEISAQQRERAFVV